MAKVSAPAPVKLSTKLTKAGTFNALSQVIVYLLGWLVLNQSVVTSSLVKWGVPVLGVNLLLVVAKDLYDNRQQ